MKAKVLAACAAAVTVLGAIAAFDETNAVSLVARKAIEFILKFVGFVQ